MASAAEASHPLPTGRRLIVTVGIMAAVLLQVLDTTIANVALPHMQASLSASQDSINWVLTSYIVASAIALPISGWLANLFGRKRFYMACVALFTASSFLCGLSPSLTWLIIFRVLQGIGGGGLAPSEQSILADTFRPDQRGLAFALYGIAVVFAPAVGPTLGGYITDHYSWHWIFLINVPVGVGSLVLSYFLLTEPAGCRLVDNEQSETNWDAIACSAAGLVSEVCQARADGVIDHREEASLKKRTRAFLEAVL